VYPESPLLRTPPATSIKERCDQLIDLALYYASWQHRADKRLDVIHELRFLLDCLEAADRVEAGLPMQEVPTVAETVVKGMSEVFDAEKGQTVSVFI
jgi:hypothetical protein